MTQTTPHAKILVVDDEKKNQNILKRFLENKQFLVAVADDGNDALVKIEEFDPECVLLDIQMPNLNGIDTLKEIKNRRPKVEVIILTASTSLSTADECFARGAFSVLEKPVNLEYLHTKIVEALKVSKKIVRKKTNE